MFCQSVVVQSRFLLLLFFLLLFIVNLHMMTTGDSSHQTSRRSHSLPSVNQHQLFQVPPLLSALQIAENQSKLQEAKKVENNLKMQLQKEKEKDTLKELGAAHDKLRLKSVARDEQELLLEKQINQLLRSCDEHLINLKNNSVESLSKSNETLSQKSSSSSINSNVKIGSAVTDSAVSGADLPTSAASSVLITSNISNTSHPIAVFTQLDQISVSMSDKEHKIPTKPVKIEPIFDHPSPPPLPRPLLPTIHHPQGLSVPPAFAPLVASPKSRSVSVPIRPLPTQIIPHALLPIQSKKLSPPLEPLNLTAKYNVVPVTPPNPVPIVKPTQGPRLTFGTITHQNVHQFTKNFGPRKANWGHVPRPTAVNQWGEGEMPPEETS